MTHPTTDLLRDALGPGLNRDADGAPNATLAGWLDGPGHLLGAIDDLVRGDDGWVRVLDPTATPAGWLGWVAQFAGVRLRRGLTDTQQRLRILETSGQRRGTVAAIEGAAAQLLTGDRRVDLTERHDDDPYRVLVITYQAQTPDPDAVADALAAEKPAGIVLDYQVRAGASYAQLADAFPIPYSELGWSYDPPATYAELAGEFPSYLALAAEFDDYAAQGQHGTAAHEGVFDTYADMSTWIPEEPT